MIKPKGLLPIILLLTACYTTPDIEGYDYESWTAELTSCEDDKLEMANILIDNQEKLLGEGQAEIKKLLGQPNENELYLRNQKFFYYDLTSPADSCEQLFQRLSLRFDALDRVKEVVIIEGTN